MPKLLLALVVVAGTILFSAPATTQTTEQASSSDTYPDLSGTWAQKVVNTSVSRIPVVGRVTSVSTAYLLVDIDQNGDQLELESQACDLQLDSSQEAVRTIVPPRFVRAMSEQTRTARLLRDGNEVEFVAPRKTTTLGVRLRNPSHERLPTEPDDARVIDQDQDGHPGVTLYLRGLVNAELYVVQRGWDALRGEVGGDSRIDGLVTWNTEQEVLGSTNIFARSPPDSSPHPDRDRSYFRTTRVDGSTTCSDLLSRRSQLFGR